jgi:hypothetical protein
MAHPAVVLVALPTQQKMLQALCAQVDIAAVINPTRAVMRDVPVPVFADWATLEQHATPGACCFLTPYSTLKKDLSRCLDQGIHVLSAGPVSLTRAEFDEARKKQVQLHFGGPHPFSRLFQQLKEQRQKPEFGQPVYLRLVQGGGSSLQAAWWSVCDALSQARDLLDSNLKEVYVTATKQGGKYHISLTGATASRANIQLVVAPIALSLYPDITFLGSGGLLSNRSMASAPLLIGQDGLEFHPHPNHHTEPSWLVDFLDKIEAADPTSADWSVLSLHHRVLGAVRSSLRQKRPIQVKLPR